jgi:hypothetical protein
LYPASHDLPRSVSVSSLCLRGGRPIQFWSYSPFIVRALTYQRATCGACTRGPPVLMPPCRVQILRVNLPGSYLVVSLWICFLVILVVVVDPRSGLQSGHALVACVSFLFACAGHRIHPQILFVALFWLYSQSRWLGFNARPVKRSPELRGPL